MAAAGDALGVITVFDLATRRLVPVQRLRADGGAAAPGVGPGPVACLAAALEAGAEGRAAAASAPRGPDGGGVVRGHVGLGWRDQPFDLDAAPVTGGRCARCIPCIAVDHPLSRAAWFAGARAAGRCCCPHVPAASPSLLFAPLLPAATEGVLLAASSDAGWLHVFQPQLPGEFSWQRVYGGALRGRGRMEFASEGGYLLVVTSEWVGGWEVCVRGGARPHGVCG